MSESELYKDLGSLTKDKNRWKESIPYVSSLLTHESVKIQAKVLWLLGEMGLLEESAGAIIRQSNHSGRNCFGLLMMRNQRCV